MVFTRLVYSCRNGAGGRFWAVTATCVTMCAVENKFQLRVRYSETDQMGTFYNSRALEWFECGRTEFLRRLGTPYARMELDGVLLPLVEAHVAYLGRARYDDLLEVSTIGDMVGKARVRFDVSIAHAEGGADVARGYTIHAVTDPEGKPIRPPKWLVEALDKGRRTEW